MFSTRLWYRTLDNRLWQKGYNASCPFINAWGIGKLDEGGVVAFVSKRRFSLPKKLTNDTHDKAVSESHDEAVKDIEKVSSSQLEKAADLNEEKAAEARTKRRMVPYQTMYGQMLKEAEPEDEEAILQYYVHKAQKSLDESDETIEYDVVDPDKKLFFRMVDLWIEDAGEVRRGHREFVQVSLNNLERFNVQNEPNAYLKILHCFPQSAHSGISRNKWFDSVFQDKILDHELGGKLFAAMNKYKVVPNDEFYDVSMALFGKFSRATARLRSYLFWYPRLTQFEAFPVSDRELEKMSRPEIVLHALRQANPSLNADYQCFEITEDGNEDELDKSNEKLTSIFSVQTHAQKEALQNHDLTQPVFVEGPHIIYFKSKPVQYYIIRADPLKKVEKKTDYRLLTDKEWWGKFYGRDYESSRDFQSQGHLYNQQSFFPKLDMNDEDSTVRQWYRRNQIKEVVDDVPQVEGKIYGMAATDVKSVEALRSWIYGLESTNSILSRITILFNEKQTFLAEGHKHKKKK